MLMWNSENLLSGYVCVLGQPFSLPVSFSSTCKLRSFDITYRGLLHKCNKVITIENFKDLLHELNTNHLMKADFFLFYHLLLYRNGSVIVIFDLFFAQWVSDENVKEELIQGIEANKSSQLVTFHIDLNSIDITGICEHYLISLNH